MPAGDWFTQTLVLAAIVYVLLAAAIISGRMRYDRRRRLFARMALLVDVSPALEPSAFHLQIDGILRGWPPRAVERVMAEHQGIGPVPQACAAWLLARLGEPRLTDRAKHARSRWKRIAALRILAFARAGVAQELLSRALSYADREIVRGAVVILGQLCDRSSAELLVRALRQGRHPRSQVAVFLQSCPGNIGDLLAPLLDDPNPLLRYWGAVLVAHHPPARTEERLVALAGDPDAPVRKAALDSLARGGFITSIPVVLTGLEDSVAFVRAHAARALGELGAIDSAAALAARLGDEDWWVRDAAKRSLVTLGRGVESTLLAHLSDDDQFARNGAAEVLQHLGTFERLLAEEAVGPADAPRRAVLVRLAEAGGLAVWDAVIAQRPEELGRQMVATLDSLKRRAAAADAHA